MGENSEKIPTASTLHLSTLEASLLHLSEDLSEAEISIHLLCEDYSSKLRSTATKVNGNLSVVVGRGQREQIIRFKDGEANMTVDLVSAYLTQDKTLTITLSICALAEAFDNHKGCYYGHLNIPLNTDALKMYKFRQLRGKIFEVTDKLFIKYTSQIQRLTLLGKETWGDNSLGISKDEYLDMLTFLQALRDLPAKPNNVFPTVPEFLKKSLKEVLP